MDLIRQHQRLILLVHLNVYITTVLTLDEHGTFRNLVAAEWQKLNQDWESRQSAGSQLTK